jgi:hypothetical protein
VKLCRQVDAGTISVREATDQFEAEREQVIQERREYNRKQKARDVGLSSAVLH